MKASHTSSQYRTVALYVDSSIVQSFNGGFDVVRFHNYV